MCCCCFYIIYFFCFYNYFIRDVRQPLSQTRLSVSMSLEAGQIIILAGINATESKVSVLPFYPWNELTLCTVNILSKGARWEYKKIFHFTGFLCYNSSSDAVFLDGRFLLDADRGNFSLLLRCESLQHTHLDLHVSRHFVVTVTMLSDHQIWCCHAVKCLDFLPFLWVGLPVIMVAISLGFPAGKEGLQSYTSDK